MDTINDDDLLAVLSTRLEPVPRTVVYKTVMALTAALMCLMLALYFGVMLGGLVLAVYLPTHARWVVDSLGLMVGVPILIVAPPVGLLISLLLMKPLIWRQRAKEMQPVVLKEEEAPKLFAYVRKLAEAAGTPVPREIHISMEVNASASFRRGFLSLFSDDLVLTLGLPMLVGLNVRQLSALVAHEFGHFAQRSALRVTYVTFTLNHYLARLVYERDRFDEWLAELAERRESMGSAFATMAQGLIWCTRQVYKLGFWASTLACFKLLRENEYDADRYSVRLAGSDSVRDLMERTQQLSIGWMKGHGELERAWADRLIVDNIPTYVQVTADRLPAKQLKRVQKALDEQKTGWFDTHPSDHDRIRRAETLKEQGQALPDWPADRLFTDFRGLCERLTAEWYLEMLGEMRGEAREMSAEEMLASSWKREENAMAVWRYFLNAIPPSTPVMLTREVVARLHIPARDTLDQLEDARDEMVDLEPKMETYFRDHGGRQEVFRSVAMQEEPPYAEMLANYRELGQRRLHAALMLLSDPDTQALLEDPQALLKERDEMCSAMIALSIQFEVVTAVQVHFLRIREELVRVINQGGDRLSYHRLMQDLRKLRHNIERAQRVLKHVPYPFEHSKQDVTVADHLLNIELPDEDEFLFTLFVAEHWIGQFYSLYYRVLGRLVRVAEQVEDVHEMPPLPDRDMEELEADDEYSILELELEEDGKGKGVKKMTDTQDGKAKRRKS